MPTQAAAIAARIHRAAQRSRTQEEVEALKALAALHGLTRDTQGRWRESGRFVSREYVQTLLSLS